MNKLVLIDGFAILHRAFHALPPLTTKSGEPINAVYGLISMLLRIVQDLRPTHIAVAFDRPEPTFRKEAFKDYQSNRPVMDDGLSSQIEKAKQTMEAFGIPVYFQAGYEADDIIGTLATKTTEETGCKDTRQKIDEVVIVTGDRDILQLVNDKVKVYLPVKGLSEGKVFGKEDVVEKMGCTPLQIIDYKALVGDSSDNYLGVPGIGPKTANDLLQKFGSFPSIYEHLDEIPEKTRQKLITGRESGEMSYKLAKIVTDMDFPFDLEEAKKWQVDSGKVLDLFSEYGFKTLTKRVQEVGKTVASENQGSLF